MEVSTKAKERFCKDCNIPIRIFQEPYFADRLKLFDKMYGTLEKWNVFTNELKKYNSEQDYFEEYNKVKDAAISTIKNSESYQRFNEEDINNFAVIYKNLPSKDIYKSTNAGRTFISIDMEKANFSSLKFYGDTISKSMFAGASTWEEFMSLFTNNEHIINSKYIRQVILGNCNPKRHITYEKYLMGFALTELVDLCICIDNVVFFSNDEIIIDVSNMNEVNKEESFYLIGSRTKCMPIPLKVEMFTLHRILRQEGYYKEIKDLNGEVSIELKCLDNLAIPFVLRKFQKEDITENDKVFYHEGLLAKFIEVPNIMI